MKPILSLLAGALLASTIWAASQAADTPPPFVIPHGTSDIGKTVAGTYTLDPNHVGLIARVPHMGFSISIFRFDHVAATLQWDPKSVAQSKLTATVETGSIATNVPNFAVDIAKNYLKAPQFPNATFVSTAFRPTDSTHGKVDGTFTLKGKSIPLTFDVTLVGAGPGFAGSPVMGHVIGIHAETWLDPKQFDIGPFFQDPIQLVIDTEFDHKG